MISVVLLSTFFLGSVLLILRTIYAQLFNKYGDVRIKIRNKRITKKSTDPQSSTSSHLSKDTTVTPNSTSSSPFTSLPAESQTETPAAVTTESHKLSDLISQSKNLADFFQRVSGVSLLEQCKYGSCQYSGVVSAIDTMKILKESHVDPFEFFGIQTDLLKEQLQKESDVLNVLTIQLSALTANEGNVELNGAASLSTASFNKFDSTFHYSFSSATTSSTTTTTSSLYSPSNKMLKSLRASSSPPSSPNASPNSLGTGFELVSENNALKFAHIRTVDDVFKTMRESSFDLWTVSRLAFQSAFNRELVSFIVPNKSHVPSSWLKKELFTDSASSLRTGMECYILEQMGFIKNMDDSLQGFQT
ncbi:hypothetical protein FDP41_001168 [Naegleria fowleri]|uniref:Uncharacterized protein n=1 Tax=Naegleria fowleri TaxID=5763 RepID=A0A6A5C3F2_NAEFO|nr:uncharacterized protein FDP41_001168 [Naegleria fowleri]KAF0980015.1 hypothetical protein FDP41_001168 [Naegleria fowleri]